MKGIAMETTKRHRKYLAAAALIALAVAFMLTGGVTTAQGLPEVNFESINVSVDEPAADGARADFEIGVLLAVRWPASGQQSDQEVPAKPTGLTGTVSPDDVSLSWDDPGDGSITGYQVLRRNPAVDAKGVFHTVVDDTGSSGTSYVDTTVAAATRYFYRVLARNAAGLSPMSGLFRADVPPPDPDATRPGATDLGDVTSQEGVNHRDGSVNGASDRLDYFRFTLTAARTVELALRRQDANGDLYLEDGDGNELASSENGGDANESIAESLDAGTYYVRVAARAGGNNNYRLRYGISPGPEQSTPENSAASGSPAITGTVEVGETLSVGTSGISDGNGLSNPQYAYHWVRSIGSTDTDISGATGSTYTPITSADRGMYFIWELRS